MKVIKVIKGIAKAIGYCAIVVTVSMILVSLCTFNMVSLTFSIALGGLLLVMATDDKI